MPEGHTIHRVARDHQAFFKGEQLIAMSPQGRFSGEAAKLNGKTFQRAEAHGKHLFYFWSGNQVVHIHLGLYGKFRVHNNPAPEPRGAVRLRMIGQDRTVDLNGPNRCELLTANSLKKLRERLGQDPLRSDADPDKAWQRIMKSRKSIGALLLDQSIIAGIGNVYRAELLFEFGICPDRPGNSLSKEDFEKIWEQSVEWLKLGVKYNRIITIDVSQVTKPLLEAGARERTMIYKSPECPRCGDDVYYWDSGNRTIYACDSCQT